MKMNKHICMVSSVLVLFAAACNGVEDQPIVGERTIKVNSTVPVIGADSRANLDTDGVTPVWETGDKIGLKIGQDAAVELQLVGGENTASGSFAGTVSASSSTMNFYYPASVAETGAVDLTQQDGSNAEEMVMFKSVAFSETPSFTFENKTAILRLEIPVPEDISFVEGTPLFVKVIGAYSKGTLGTDGNWTDCTMGIINVDNATIVSGKVSAYVVVIPGSNVNGLRIHVGGKVSATQYKDFVTGQYTSQTAVIAPDNIVAIRKSAVVPAVNYKATYAPSDYYKWDAPSSYPDGGAQNSTVTGSDNARWDYPANDWTRQCPTYEQACILLSNGLLFVADTDTENGLEYVFSGVAKKHYGGIWLKKLVYCDITKRNTKISSTYYHKTLANKNNGQYFFLPNMGFYDAKGIHYIGTQGRHWLCSPGTSTASAYYLYVLATETTVNYGNRQNGNSSWTIE